MSRGAFEHQGLSPEEAHHAARRRIGGSPLHVREQAVEVWSWRELDVLMQDIRYGARVLKRQPRFLAAALVRSHSASAQTPPSSASSMRCC